MAAVLALSVLQASAAPPVAGADVTSRWAMEQVTTGGYTRGWMVSDRDYPISVFPVDPTAPGYDPDTLIVYGGSPHLNLIGPDGAPIEVGQYDDVGDVEAPTPGHAGMGFYAPGAYCGGWSGSFTVHELVRESNAVTQLSVDYAGTCSTGLTARGQVRFHSTRTLVSLRDTTWYDEPVYVGQAPVGDTATSSFTYTNTGDTVLHLGTPTISGADAADFAVLAGGCNGATLAVGEACDLSVRFTTSRVGWAQAMIEFTVDTPLGVRRLPVRGRGVTPTSITLAGSTGTHYAPQVLTFDGQVTPAPAGADIGDVKIMLTSDAYGYGWELARGTTAADGTYHFEATVGAYPGPGAYHATAEYSGSFDGNHYLASTSATSLPITLQGPTQTSITSSLNPVLSTVPATITVTAWAGGQAITGGSLTITDAFDGAIVGSGPVAPGVTTATLDVAKVFAAGSHELTASYSGHDLLAPSEAKMTLSVTKDEAVAATGIGVSPSTFYPVKDGYRDTLAIRGRLNEPGTVAIKIVSAVSGKTVRTASIPLTTGAYAWGWNGRNAAGTMVAAGRYMVVQTLTDTGGNKLVSTAYATLSTKRLVWTTATKTLYAEQFKVKGSGGGGSVSTSRSSYARGVRLASGSGWAAVSYAFAVPSATAYGNVTFKVQGRSLTSRKAEIAIWSPSAGSYAYTSAYDAWAWAGTAYAWYSTKAPLGSHRGGGYVRALILVENLGGKATFDANKVSITYRYGVLK